MTHGFGVFPLTYSLTNGSMTLCRKACSQFSVRYPIPIRSAILLASSISQQRLSSPSCDVQVRRVTPITSYPCFFSRYAATALSTPPDMPTITFAMDAPCL